MKPEGGIRDSGLTGPGIADSSIGRARDVSSERSPTRQAPCITSSFQAECVVLTHMLREERPDIPVLFLDTFHHFPQTLAYRDEMTERWGLNLINLRAKEPQVGLWQARARRRAARGTRWSRSSRRSRGTTRGSRRCAATSRRRARTCRKSSRSSCRQDDLADRADRRLDGPRRVEVREGSRHPAAAALRARLHEHRLRAVHGAALRSRQPALGPLAGPEARVRDTHPGEVGSRLWALGFRGFRLSTLGLGRLAMYSRQVFRCPRHP